MATTINAYLTKSYEGEVELWKSKPVFYDGKWREGDKTEVGSDILDGFLDDFVKRNECVKIQITKR